jgi:RNA polymerase sigma factor (TIGR02999 family)
MPDLPQNATQLLAAVSSGDESAKNKLFAVVYGELHRMAHRAMRGENPRHTLQTTALVHEAYIRLVPGKEARWQDRGHFFSVAAKAMRRILAGEARKKRAAKRGSGQRPVTLDRLGEPGADQTPEGIPMEDLEMLDLALDKLGEQEGSERLCTMVELRFFVGLTLDQTAEVLGVSKATVKRDWEFTRAWLYKEMNL